MQVLSFIDLRTAHESMETGAFMNVKVFHVSKLAAHRHWSGLGMKYSMELTQI